MNLTVGMSFVRYFHVTYQACFAAEHLVRVNYPGKCKQWGNSLSTPGTKVS